MALSILDGNQSTTTLSTILSSGQHITAHTVVSLGTQAITDMRGAVSGSVVSISNLPSTQTIAGTVTANGGNFAYAQDEDTSNPSDRGVLIGWRDDANGSFRNTSDAQPLPISGTVTANGVWNDNNPPSVAGTGDSNPVYGVGIAYASVDGAVVVSDTQGLPISGTVTIGSALPAGTNRIGVVTIGAGTVTLGAGTAQIGSVTASGTVTANLSNTVNATYTAGVINAVPVVFTKEGAFGGNILGYDGANTSLNINIKGSLPALVAGTAQIGSVTASISNSVVTFYPMQGTSVSNTNFTSVTASTTLVSAVTMRESLTVFNEGAGNLHISPGGTCTTISYQVRLSAGDYWECPQGQLSLAHTAVFATAGTARVTQVS